MIVAFLWNLLYVVGGIIAVLALVEVLGRFNEWSAYQSEDMKAVIVTVILASLVIAFAVVLTFAGVSA